MRKILYLVAVLLGAIVVQAQNLTMNQLLALRKMDLGAADEYLTARGWGLMKANEAEGKTLAYTQYAFDRIPLSEMAQSFLNYIDGGVNYSSRIVIYVFNKNKYTEYLNAIKSYGCKMILSEIKDGMLEKVYQGATTTFIITSSATKNEDGEDQVTWIFSILLNDAYYELPSNQSMGING